jgi:uncharacterized protein (TIGR02145 family)
MKRKNKIQLLLVAAFAGLSVMCYAQGKLCTGTNDGYKIVSLQDPSDLSSYKWTEDGAVISGAIAAEYTVPKDKPVGKYTYVRHSMKTGCDWAASNAYTVEVLDCGEIAGGASNGATGTFKDLRDGKVYKTVKMADGQVWMAENLNFQNGLTFLQDANQPSEGHVVGSFWCPAANGSTLSSNKNTCNALGALYTWETAMSASGVGSWTEPSSSNYFAAGTTPADDKAKINNAGDGGRGICPSGWHIPTDYEWATLLDLVDTKAEPDYTAQTGTGWYGSDGVSGSDNVGAGVKMKSASTYIGTDSGNGAWTDNDNRGNNATGFGAVPAGGRNVSGGPNGSPQFSGRGINVSYWSSSVGSTSTAWYRNFYYNYAQVYRANASRSYGVSVRCVKD